MELILRIVLVISGIYFGILKIFVGILRGLFLGIYHPGDILGIYSHNGDIQANTGWWF